MQEEENDLIPVECNSVPPIPATSAEGLKIDLELLMRLCKIGCSASSCAYVVGCTTSALAAEFKAKIGIDLEEFIEHHREYMKIAIRAKQYEKAMDGDTKMLVHLGKHMLDQVDEPALNKNPNKMKNIPDNVLVQIVNNNNGKTTVKSKNVGEEEKSLARMLGKEVISNVKQIK